MKVITPSTSESCSARKHNRRRGRLKCASRYRRRPRRERCSLPREVYQPEEPRAPTPGNPGRKDATVARWRLPSLPLPARDFPPVPRAWMASWANRACLPTRPTLRKMGRRVIPPAPRGGRRLRGPALRTARAYCALVTTSPRGGTTPRYRLAWRLPRHQELEIPRPGAESSRGAAWVLGWGSSWDAAEPLKAWGNMRPFLSISSLLDATPPSPTSTERFFI